MNGKSISVKGDRYMMSFFTIEAYDFDHSTKEKRTAQLKKAFFSSAISTGIIAVIGSILWNPYFFAFGGALALLIFLLEPITNHSTYRSARRAAWVSSWVPESDRVS